MFLLFRQFANRYVNRKTMTCSHRGETFEPPRVTLYAIKWTDTTFGDGEILIKYEIRVDFHARTKTSTGRTGALWSIEGK